MASPRPALCQRLLLAALLAAALSAEAASKHTAWTAASPVHSAPDEFRDALLGDVSQSCNLDTVQDANSRQLHPILQDLVQTAFFRLFRTRLKNPSCPFWKKPSPPVFSSSEPHGSCSMTSSAGALGVPSEPVCGVRPEAESEAEPLHKADQVNWFMTLSDQAASQARPNESGDCEFEEDLPEYWADMCSSSSSQDYEDVNLLKNPERNTGYNGSHIWEAMYRENCFEVGRGLPRGRYGDPESMCYEERVLYRLLSGWHAVTTLAIAVNFYAPGAHYNADWTPNPALYMRVVGSHADRVKNLHFSFVVILRAIKKASPLLRSHSYTTGQVAEDQQSQVLMTRLLDSQVLSVCSPLFHAFDETMLFRNISALQRSHLKRSFKSVFQNITVLVDCVQCQRCRLHAKLFVRGLGSALKILLTPPSHIPATISRDEIVAIINVLWRLSSAMEDARYLAEVYWQQHGVGAPEAADDRVRAEGVPVPSLSQPPSPQVSVLDSESRLRHLDAALRAVRSAGAGSGPEETLLRALIAGPADDKVLLLAKHYASHDPKLFTRVALASIGERCAAADPTKPPAAAAHERPLGVPGGTAADAIVLGGGLAGMAASMTLLERGARVVLIDKQAYLGGNSGKASSGINAAIGTSVESLVADTARSAAELARPPLIETLARDSASAVTWLRDTLQVDLSLTSQLGGHTAKRTQRPANAFVGAEITFAAGQLLTKAASAEPSQMRILLGSKFTNLSRGGVGWQVTVAANGSALVFEAPSVLITSGGFGHDHDEAESFLIKHRPDLAGWPTTLGSQTTGDGLRIAEQVGAELVDMDRVQLHPTGFVDLKKPEERSKVLAAELLRGVGGLLLDRRGRRFTNELGTRQAVVAEELAAAEQGLDFTSTSAPRTFLLVLNAKAAAAAGRHVALYSRKGLLKRAEGLQDLAAMLGIESSRLMETFEEYNAAASAGQDEFNRTVFPPHVPIEAGEEFYVGYITPVIHYTMGGIAIDSDGQVLARNGTAMPGLYAAGEVSGGVHGANRLAGNSLLECTVFGRRVGFKVPMGSLEPMEEGRPTAAVAVSAPSKAAAAPRIISRDELAAHKTIQDRVWVALHGEVYDVTEMVAEHPGGEEAILNVGGEDGTEEFSTVHSRDLLKALNYKPLGRVAV